MAKEKLQLRAVGKGFALLASNDLPLMRRLVDAYKDTNGKTYIKVGGRLHPLSSSHKFISGN